jgi:hypothetical protein
VFPSQAEVVEDKLAFQKLNGLRRIHTLRAGARAFAGIMTAENAVRCPCNSGAFLRRIIAGIVVIATGLSQRHRT